MFHGENVCVYVCSRTRGVPFRPVLCDFIICPPDWVLQWYGLLSEGGIRKSAAGGFFIQIHRAKMTFYCFTVPFSLLWRFMTSANTFQISGCTLNSLCMMIEKEVAVLSVVFFLKCVLCLDTFEVFLHRCVAPGTVFVFGAAVTVSLGTIISNKRWP